MKRPNIIFVLTDQWHPRCVGFAGHPVVRTPHLDAMARCGMVFERMYTPQPLCAPARASILTGLTPRGHGVRMNGIPLRPNLPTFVDALRCSGYQTHGVGKMHFSVTGVPRGRTVAELDPAEFPECAALWRAGRISSLPTPFYGFDMVEYATGHGHHIVGDYLRWLEREHPASAAMVKEPAMLAPPTAAFELYNREAFKWALPAAHHPTTWVVDRCVDFLQRRSATAAAERPPFFLFCSINDPHSPFAAPAPYCDRFNPADVPPPLERPGELDALPPHFRAMIQQGVTTSGNPSEPMDATRPHYAECAAQYYGLIELIDDQLGRLLAALRASGEEDNTLVVFTADHGEALGDHGLWGKGPYHYDGVIRVPFVACWPGRIRPGSVISAPCSLLDLAPTFLSVAGVPIPAVRPVEPPEANQPPPAWPGVDLRPVFEGQAPPDDRAVLVEMDEDYLGFRMRTLVTRQHRLTMYSGQPYGELFDLAADPGEFVNLWAHPAATGLREQLERRLLHEIVRTDNGLPRQLCRA